MFRTVASMFSGLAVLLMALSPMAKAVQTEYPTIMLISVIRVYLDPLGDPNDCESGGGMIAEVNCHLREFGVSGIGVYNAPEYYPTGELRRLFQIEVTDATEDGYEYKVVASLDETAKDGTALVKFMNYWFSEKGKVGKMEIYPTVPDGNGPPITHAFSVEWDSRVSSNQRLSVVMNSRANDNARDWLDRENTFKMEARINEDTGTAEIAAAVNFLENDGSGNFAAYSMHMRRNATHTLAWGRSYDGTGTNAQEDGFYECADSGSYEIIQTDANSVAGLEDSCGALAASDFELASIAPTQQELQVFGRAGFME